MSKYSDSNSRNIASDMIYANLQNQQGYTYVRTDQPAPCCHPDGCCWKPTDCEMAIFGKSYCCVGYFLSVTLFMIMGIILLSIGIADCTEHTQYICVGALHCPNNDGVVYGPCTSSDTSGVCANNCFLNNTSIYTYGYYEGERYCNSICNNDHSSYCYGAYTTCYGGYTAMTVFGAIIMAFACCCCCCGGCSTSRVRSYSKRINGTIPSDAAYTMEMPIIVTAPAQQIVVVEARPIYENNNNINKSVYNV